MWGVKDTSFTVLLKPGKDDSLSVCLNLDLTSITAYSIDEKKAEIMHTQIMLMIHYGQHCITISSSRTSTRVEGLQHYCLETYYLISICSISYRDYNSQVNIQIITFSLPHILQ